MENFPLPPNSLTPFTRLFKWFTSFLSFNQWKQSIRKIYRKNTLILLKQMKEVWSLLRVKHRRDLRHTNLELSGGRCCCCCCCFLFLPFSPAKRQLWVTATSLSIAAAATAAATFPIQDGGHGHLGALASDAPSQLNVLGHNGDALGMDGAQIGVLKQTNQIRLAGLLENATNKHNRLLHDHMKLRAQMFTHTWRAPMAADWKRRSVLKSWAISRTNRWKGSLRMRSSVDFW